MARLKKRGVRGAWALFEKIDGKDVRIVLGHITQAEAEAKRDLATAREKERKLGVRHDRTESGVLFVDYAKTYLADYELQFPQSLYKVQNHLVHLVDGFGDLPLRSGREAEQQWDRAWKKYRRARVNVDGVSPSTVQAEWMTLRKCLKEAVPSEIQESPLRLSKFDMKVEASKIHFFQPEDLDRIYQAAGPLAAATWRFNVCTGLRRGEILQQLKSKVGRDEMEVVQDARSGLRTKSNKSRAIPLSPGAQESRDQILFYHTDGPFFFKPKSCKSDWSKQFRMDRDAAGLDQGTLHSLRHTFISYLVNEKREPLPVVMELAGHSKIETTMRYVHTSPDQLVRAVASLDL